MDKFRELEELVASMKSDINKIFTKNNSAAGVRVRKQLQTVKDLAQEIRVQIQEVKAK